MEIYSNSQKEWFEGIINNIFNDDEGEWLKVQYTAYDLKKNKQIQRYNTHVRPIGSKKESISRKNNNVDINMDESRKKIHLYVDKTLNELHELGFKNMDKTLSAIKQILNISDIINYIDISSDDKYENGKGKGKDKGNGKGHHGKIPSMDKELKGWTCKKCTLVNYKDFKNCIACNEPSPN